MQKGERLLRLEKLPMELLILLVQRGGELVSREEIAERLWGKDVFVDIDHSINTAIRKIRLALRDDPEKPRFVETVVGKGYRFAAPVISSNGDSNSQAQPLPSPVQVTPVPAAHSKEARHVSARLWMMLAGVAALTIFVVALTLFRGRAAKSTRPPPIGSIAVLPLKNLSGDPNQEYLADGMTEELIGRLSAIHDLRVISRTSAMQFRDTKLSAPEIASALHVDALVEGSVTREGSRVRVHAQLIRGATDEHFWSETYDRDFSDVLALQSDVAQSIAEKVKVTVTGKERERLTAVRSVSPEAYESYLKGWAAFDKSNSRAGDEESIGYFQEAINQEPTFAPAYLGLARAYNDLSTILIGGATPGEARPKVISAARKALELDPDLAEAHLLLANTLQKQWHWAEAKAEYRRALELSPNDARAHAAFGSWLMCQGDIEDALSWAQRGRELDPLVVDGSDIGWILFMGRRYDEAIRELRSVLAVHPESVDALGTLGFVLIADGRSQEAIPILEKRASLLDRSPGGVELLATAYARAGRRTEALRLVEELKLRRQKGYIPPGAFINPYLALGEYDEAFVWFERAYREQSNILKYLKVHPFFDPVRSDPRFKDLLLRTGLN
ncbi:MAG TPA: tetratricopeptide repeat protein [Candidatus Limnocylindrales bacterium]|nr:tetratricopeptide repeat protein [Candidatus Limnocylindrales bacterium]